MTDEKSSPPLGLLGDLSQLETPQSLSETLRQLNRRGNAGMTMMVATRLDQWLEATIKEHFQNRPRRLTDKLFGLRDPLGSFSAKIDIAFGMGAIERRTYNTLRTIRDIRNGFAHTHKEMDFYSPELDKHFGKLPPKKDREVAFIDAAVNCINDIKLKLNTRILARVLGGDASPDKSQQPHPRGKDPTQGQT